MKDYLKLLRVKHYIKNFLVFVPLFFGGEMLSIAKLGTACLGCFAFSAISSAIYILNDLQDIEKDRKHPTKCKRPLASGRIKKEAALVMLGVCICFAAMISVLLGSPMSVIYLALYFALNVAYSMGLKNKPIIDVVILASGFVLRIYYGGSITGIQISTWLFLVVAVGSLYMGLGKRRNELMMTKSGDTRAVLQYYNKEFLDKNMYVCMALADVFYAMWTLEMSDIRMRWTIPLFIVLLMCYSLNVEGNSDGDPVEVIMQDKILVSLILLYAIGIFSLLYIF